MTAEFAISVFVTLSTGLFFLLPKMYGKFSENVIVQTIITRCCYVIGFYLMVMNAGIIAEIASTAGYTTAIIFRYMWLFGLAGYLLMFITGIKTLFDITNLYKKIVNEKRGLD